MDQNDSKLMKMAEERAARRGAPSFAVKEGDLLQMKQRLQEVVVSNNKLVEAMKPLMAMKVADRAVEAHMMMQVILGILVEKGLTSQADLNELAQKFQMESGGLMDKAPGSLSEVGDVMLIKFKMFDGDKLVDDQTSSLLSYNLGSKDLPCDEGMVGMQKGEMRTFEVVFGAGFRFAELVGKPLLMHIWCHEVKTRGIPDALEAVAPEKQ